MRHQRLGTTKRGRQLRDLYRFNECTAGIESTNEFKRQLPTRNIELSLRKFILRMRCKTGPTHRRNLWVRFKKLCDFASVLALTIETNAQGAQTTKCVHRIEGRCNRALNHGEGIQPIDVVGCASNDADRGIVMTGNALGGRMNDEVDTKLKRTLCERRCKCGIHDLDRTLDRTELGKVNEIKTRIRRSFGINHCGAARDHRSSERTGFGAVDKRDVNAKARAHRLEQQLCCAVQLILRDDVIALRTKAQHNRTDCTHARCKCSGLFRTFKLRNGVFKTGHRRVAITGIEPRRPNTRRHLACFVDRRSDERGCCPKDRRKGSVVIGTASANRTGFGVKV